MSLQPATKYAYGVDFGTTNSTICLVDNGKVRKLQIDQKAPDPSILRSVIYVNSDFEFLFGSEAVSKYLEDVASGKGTVKRVIETGKKIKIASDAGLSGVKPDKWVDEIWEIEEFEGGRLLQTLKSALSSNVVSHMTIFGKEMPLEEVIAIFLKEMKTRADKLTGMTINKAVIGRPVEYVGHNNALAVERMTKAAHLAGFEEVEFEYEPVGAAYDYASSTKAKQTVLVFDFGGGTLDISVFRLPERQISVNTGLPIGGDYFNSKIFMEKLAKYFGSKTKYGLQQLPLPRHIFNYLQSWYKISLLKNVDFTKSMENFRSLNSDPKTMDALESLVDNNLGFAIYEEVERVKKQLSQTNEEEYKFNAKAISIQELITRNAFEKIIADDIKNINQLISDSLKKANLKVSDIDSVVTTGGSSLIPVVRNLLEKIFGKDKLSQTDTFTSVASGLALRAQEIYN